MNSSTFTARQRPRRISPALVVAFTIFSMLAAFFPSALPAEASHVTPELRSGNPSCGEFGDWQEAKLEPVSSGTYTFGDLEVTVSVRNTDDGQVFDWSSNISLDAVFVKGGPNGNLYTYDPEATSDTGLHSPVNETNGDYYGLSHISFCYEIDPANVSAASLAWTCEGGLTVSATNDGDEDATLSILKDGTEIDSVVVPANSSITNVAVDGENLAEDETATFTAVFDGTTVDSLSVDADCVQIPDVTEATLAWNCTDGLTVSATNDGDGDGTLTIFKDGTQIDTVTVPAESSITNVAIDGENLSEGDSATFTVEFDDSELDSLAVTNVDCVQVPDISSASLAYNCTDGLTVSATNDGDAAGDLEVYKDGVLIDTISVPAGGSITDEPVTGTALSEGDTATFTVEFDDSELDSLEVTEDCVQVPDISSASLAWNCTDGLTVSATNDGDAAGDLEVYKDGVLIDTISVPAGSSISDVAVDGENLAEGDDATFTVEFDGDQLTSLDVTDVDCEQIADLSAVSLAWNCTDGLTVSATNDGDADGTLSILKNGAEIDSVVVPAGSSITDVAVAGENLAEGDDATFTVEFDGDQLTSLVVTDVDCQPTPPPPPCEGTVMVEVRDATSGELVTVDGGESTVEGSGLDLEADGTTDVPGTFDCDEVSGTLDVAPTGYDIVDGSDSATIDEDGEQVTLVFTVTQTPTTVDVCEGALEVVVIGPDGSIIDGPVELNNVEIVTTFDDDSVVCGQYTVFLDEDALAEGVSLARVSNTDDADAAGPVQIVTVNDGDEDRVVFELVQVEGVAIDRPDAPAQPAPDAPEDQPAPETEGEELARTGVRIEWLLMLAMIAMLGGVAFLRIADSREEARA